MDIITTLPPTDHQLVINGGKTGMGGASKEPKASRNTKGTILTEDHRESGNTLGPEPIHEESEVKPTKGTLHAQTSTITTYTKTVCLLFSIKR